jgi:uncharacterized membrane protein
MIKDIIIIYVLLLLFDFPVILNNKMYNDLFLEINNNNKLELTNSVYFSIFIVYLLISCAIFYFVIKNTKKSNDILINAFFLGIIIYGVYDFTNYATIIKYNKKVVIMDTLWGGILFFLVTGTYLKLTKRF